MNRSLVSILALALAGCATSAVIPTGPETYSLSATRCGLCTPVSGYVTEEASKYCQSQGKHLVVNNVTGNNMQPMFPGSATINFSCVSQDNAQLRQEAKEECVKEYAISDLDPIRNKVELYRNTADAPPPFEMAANEAYPTEIERKAIAKWANLRDACLARQREIAQVPASATPIQAAFIEQDAAFSNELAAKVSALIVALYQGKLNFGEFAQKRYEFARDGAAAEREFRAATLIQDQQRAMQAQQLAQQNFQNRLAAWSTYLQVVNSRPPQTTIRVEQNVVVH
jgi:hypothetical protein